MVLQRTTVLRFSSLAEVSNEALTMDIEDVQPTTLLFVCQ